jgi:hypothetical protein
MVVTHGMAVARWLRRAAGSLGAALLLCLSLGSPAVAHGAARGRRDPASNRHLSARTENACAGAPDGASCTKFALADLNAARTSEGLRPMKLPPDFGKLTIAQQLLVVSDFERVGRGLAPALGLSRTFDKFALKGALADTDPEPPNPLDGDVWGSNWETGFPSTLEADFMWMYDDGYGSFNVACPHRGASGCWGHRHNILYPYRAPVMMGAAAAATSDRSRADMTELFVGGDTRTKPGQRDAPLPPVWASFMPRR